MVYVMSDLHGCFDLYKKMLDKIKLSDNDTLYILGDILDRGEGGIKIIWDIIKHKNIIPLVGNHDYTAYIVLKRLYSPIPKKECKSEYLKNVISLYRDWIKDGGQPTYDAFQRLSEKEREEFFCFIENMDTYAEITVGKNDFVLTHSGLGHFDKKKPLSKYPLDDLIWARMNYNEVYFDGKYLVSGHTPTGLIDKEYSGRIYRKNNHIAIDCGAVFCGTLGCIRLDDFKEFYIE